MEILFEDKAKARKWLKDALHERFIRPTIARNDKYIGIEIEMPVVSLSGGAVNYDIVHKVTDSFVEKFGFAVTKKDDEGKTYAAEEASSGDIISFDCSYTNLELSLGRQKNLNLIYEEFVKYYSYLSEELRKYGHCLTGMGINPNWKINDNRPIPNSRYRMLYRNRLAYTRYTDAMMYFFPYPECSFFASASQVQLDVKYDKLLKTLQVFEMVEPVKAVLFSNSVLAGDYDDFVCVRDLFWEYSTHGINPHNIGMCHINFDTMDEYLEYLCSMSLFCAEKRAVREADGSLRIVYDEGAEGTEKLYLNFRPVPMMEYFLSDKIQGEYYDNYSGEFRSIEFRPEKNDISYMRSYKYVNLTGRGTIEYRSACNQPISDVMTVSAFHLGLTRKLDELIELLSADRSIYGHGYNKVELRKMFIRRNHPSFVDEDKVYELARKVLDISRKGLAERGEGEEKYLDPLYRRIENRTNPGKYMLDRLDRGESLESLILKYSEL